MRDRVPRGAADELEAFRAATYPEPYPAAWYVLCEADAVRPGQVREVTLCGERLAVFRTRDGQVGVLEGFCPHLGARLADGQVVGGTLRCRFHGWRFDTCGRVVEVPYSPRPPRPSLRARSWQVRDYYGFLCVFRGGPGQEQPTFQLPPLPEIDTGAMVFRGARDGGTVDMHLVEFAENSVDFGHFPVLHRPMKVPYTDLRIPWMSIEHEPGWERDPDHWFVIHFSDRATLRVLGRLLPRSSASARLSYLGPGTIGVFRFTVPRVGRMILLQTHTPEQPLRQRLRFRWYAEPRFPRLMIAWVVGNWIAQLREDQRIWERKIYRRRPLLVPGDGPVHALRQWYRQFCPSPPGGQPDPDGSNRIVET
ncbi:MAG: Rieske 2Fe-2S domain-containing protein [Myxococcales bacterium]|nr:Rieske 2Fe-2S domain-containing protein [Myxococcota bacterium]MDW8282077.1 Rieske 2Fe-2S domain-containing protein [Myxococcales bacterium]